MFKFMVSSKRVAPSLLIMGSRLAGFCSRRNRNYSVGPVEKIGFHEIFHQKLDHISKLTPILTIYCSAKSLWRYCVGEHSDHNGFELLNCSAYSPLSADHPFQKTRCL